MTKTDFTRRVTAMTKTLYRVSYGLLRREADREDAVQEAILRAWEKLPSLRQERYFETWLIRILINACRDIGRKSLPVVSMDEAPEPSAPPESHSLRDAVLALPEELRLVVMLHHVEGYGVGETAALLDIPVGTVKSRLYRARSILKHELEEEAT